MSGRDAHREIDAEELPPEPRHVAVDFLARHHVHRFHDDEDPRQPERQRDEQEVVERRRGELQPRQVDDVKARHAELPAPATRTCSTTRSGFIAIPGARGARKNANHSRASATTLIARITMTSRARGLTVRPRGSAVMGGRVTTGGSSAARRKARMARHYCASGRRPSSAWRKRRDNGASPGPNRARAAAHA